MLTADCSTESSYVRVSDTCLLRVSKDAPKLPGNATSPEMRFTVLRRAKVRSLLLLPPDLASPQDLVSQHLLRAALVMLPQCFLSNHASGCIWQG